MRERHKLPRISMDEPESELVIVAIKNMRIHIFLLISLYFLPCQHCRIVHKEFRDEMRWVGCCICDGCGEWGNQVRKHIFCWHHGWDQIIFEQPPCRMIRGQCHTGIDIRRNGVVAVMVTCGWLSSNGCFSTAMCIDNHH